MGVNDLSWLLAHGYAPVSALKLVGDRWGLTERQRQAVRRGACSDEARSRRLAHRVEPDAIRGCDLLIDGFNVLTTIEAALGGAVVLACRDSTYRDIAGVHGTYRRVAETLPALDKIVALLSSLGAGHCRWLFDRPVSNSGRVRELVLAAAPVNDTAWSAELVSDPDPMLRDSSAIVATADSAVLDRANAWFNLARVVVEQTCPHANVVDLSGDLSPGET